MADALWTSVVLLLHCDGAQDSTTFTDKSCAELAVAAISPGRVDNAIKEYGTGSLIVDGTGGSIYVYAAAKSKELTVDFCIEMSVYIDTFDTTRLVLFNNSGLKIRITDAQKLQLYSLDADYEDYTEHTGSTTLSAETWYKIAVSWDGTTLRAFLNGALEISTTDFAPDDSGWYIGGADAGVGVAYIDEIRVTREEARYTSSSYSVATAAWEDESCGSSIEEADGAATLELTATAIGRGLPYGETSAALTGSGVGAATATATGTVTCSLTASGVGVSAVVATVPVVINRVITVSVGVAIHIHPATAVSTVSLPIHLGTYPKTVTLPIVFNVPVAVPTVTLPIHIYGDSADLAAEGFVAWKVKVTIGGVDFSSKLIGSVEIETEENASPVASFALIPANGAVDPLGYVGSAVQIWWQQYVGGGLAASVLRFTGVVSDPTWDADERILSISATGDLQGKLDNLTKTEIDTVLAGASPTFSEYVFGPPEDLSGFEYAEASMSTTDHVLWMDVAGTIRTTSTLAKATADYTWGIDDLIAGTLGDSPGYPGRQDLVNKIVVVLEYRFDRRRQRHITCRFRDGANLDTPSTYLSGNLGGWELPQRTQVESAAESGGWVVIGDIAYVDVWPTGLYPTYSDSGVAMYEGWANQPVVTDELCIGATWTAARRWIQTVTETATLTVNATESQGVVGVLTDNVSYSIQDEATDDEWESSMEYTGYKAGATVMSNGIDRRSDLDTLRTAFETAQEVAVARARHDILMAHRGTTVTCALPFVPSLDLSHTVAIDTTYLDCKGKVRRITDRMDLDSGDCVTTVDVALYRHNASGLLSDTPIAAVDKADDPDETSPRTSYTFGMFIGHQDNMPTWASVEGESGFFVNLPWNPTYGTATLLGGWARNPANPDVAKRVYEEGFRLQYPDIDSSYSDPTNAATTAAFEVAVPQDTLVLISG